MATVKKNTINRYNFETEMLRLKEYIRTYPLDTDALIKEINSLTYRLIEYIDEKQQGEDPFCIPEWINQDVTVSIGAKSLGDYYGY